MTTTISPLTNGPQTLMCVCVDPEAAAEYGDRAYIVPGEDIACTDEQALVINALNAAGCRVVSVYGTEDCATWRITFVTGSTPGEFGTVFNTVTVLLHADGSSSEA